MTSNIRIITMLGVVAATAFACAVEEASPRRVGERAASLGVEEYVVTDDVVTLLGAEQQPLGVVEGSHRSDGTDALVLSTEDHTLAVEAVPGAGISLRVDDEELFVGAPGDDLGTIDLGQSEFDHLMMVLAVQEDIGLGSVVVAEDDGSISYGEQYCVKARPCLTIAGHEIVCISIEICYVDGT